MTSRGAAGLTALVRAPNRADRWRSLVIILVGAPVAAGILRFLIGLMTDAEIARVVGIVTGAAGLLTGVAQWTRKQAEWLAAQQDKVEEAQRKYDEALKAKLAEHSAKVISKQQELALAQQDYLVAQQRRRTGAARPRQPEPSWPPRPRRDCSGGSSRIALPAPTIESTWACWPSSARTSSSCRG